ncbi:MAG TPA: NUDIX hydrolase [Caulobacteraceae bacterium]|nr:NUDIX hydrolase [Caulobacteraceae bacterium]
MEELAGVEMRALRRIGGEADLATAVQYAALPYRMNDEVEVLLLTSRETGRWVLPKGWPIAGKSPRAAARQEALEEAGVIGRVCKQPIGVFHYDKRLDGGGLVTCKVVVYPLEVTRQLKRWPEQGQRTTGWFRTEDAALAVLEPELAILLYGFTPPKGDEADKG